MLKQSFYFSHDANARHDPKCAYLIMKHGYEGYGIFWALNEIMRTEREYKLPFAQCPGIAFDLKIENTKLLEIIDTCISPQCGLYNRDDECFWSDRLCRGVELADRYSKNGMKGAAARWKKEKGKDYSPNFKDGNTIVLYDGTVAIRRYGEWVDQNSHAKLDRNVYKELP